MLPTSIFSRCYRNHSYQVFLGPAGEQAAPGDAGWQRRLRKDRAGKKNLMVFGSNPNKT